MFKSKLVRIVGLSWFIVGISFLLWLYISYKASGFNPSVLEPSPTVNVVKFDNRLEFEPVKKAGKIFVFFPGALVDPYAYAPMCHKIAEAGFKAVIVFMPYRLAQFGYNKPSATALFSDTSKQYFLSGHSKGAAIATRFIHEKIAKISGLILMGTTHPVSFDLSDLKIPVMKIYGLNDGVATPGKVESNKNKLPEKTIFVPIAGGNHSQFAYYGFQLGDKKAGISRDEQQRIIVSNVINFMKSNN